MLEKKTVMDGVASEREKKMYDNDNIMDMIMDRSHCTPGKHIIAQSYPPDVDRCGFRSSPLPRYVTVEERRGTQILIHKSTQSVAGL